VLAGEGRARGNQVSRRPLEHNPPALVAPEPASAPLALGTFRYRHVRDLLANNRDLVAEDAAVEWISPAHANVRGPDYYQ